MQKYTLTFINYSSLAGSVCVYQKPVDIGVPNAMSLAWLTYHSYPSTEVDLTWSIDYSFVWSKTGVLKPGVEFRASQRKIADLDRNNKIAFTHTEYGLIFMDQTDGPNGTLWIDQDGTIAVNTASVGIGMSGEGVFAVQAQPNFHLGFTPHPNYWITFGCFEKGMVLDIQQITDSCNIEFPYGIYQMYAILGLDNRWTITQERP